MIIQLLARFAAWLAPPSPSIVPDLPGDGRRFAWINATQYAKEGGQSPLVPVVLYDPLVCGEARLAIVVSRVLLPSEYGDSLDVLAARYPAPPVPVEAPPKVKAPRPDPTLPVPGGAQ